MTGTSTNSYQLPDLLSILHPFELRTNRHCHTVSQSSEKWAKSEARSAFTSSELDDIERTRAGILSAICFPTTDLMQLEFLTQFLTLLITCNMRMSRKTQCGWENGLEELEGIECLTTNPIFSPLKERILRFVVRANTKWHQRFTRSVHQFRAAQLKIASRLPTTLSMHANVEIRRDSSGLGMLLDLMQIAEGLDIDDTTQLSLLQTHTQNIIIWSLDIIAYNIDQSIGNTHNLVALLMQQKGTMSIQTGVQNAAKIVEEELAQFFALEKNILFPDERTTSTNRLWSLFGSHSQAAAPPIVPPDDDVRAYIRGLRDCIVGFINWTYETNLFLGEKSEEVRWFRWVFLLPPEEAGSNV